VLLQLQRGELDIENAVPWLGLMRSSTPAASNQVKQGQIKY
jgi:hypothetical protein